VALGGGAMSETAAVSPEMGEEGKEKTYYVDR
jgi:hypothetical protein